MRGERAFWAPIIIAFVWACGSPAQNDFTSAPATKSASGGSAGASSGAGGTSGSGGSGGSSSSGSGGTGGTGGASTGSGGTGGSGAGGSGGSSGGGGESGGEDDPIDKMEDGTPQILVSGGRDGYWYSYGDMSDGSQLQPAEGADFIMGYVDPPREGSNRAARLQGQNFDDWGATMAVDFRMGNVSYDASEYSGVSFFARSLQGPLNIRVDFPDVNSSPHGGVCGDGKPTACFAHYHKTISLGQEWAEFEIPFSALEGVGTPAFQKDALFGVQFTVPGPVQSFDIWVDDLVFTR